MLKKGGKLIISDMYEKDPDPKQLKAIKIEAERQSKIPHKEGDCENDQQRFVDFRFKGAFFKDPLIAQLKEIGYRIVEFEDRSQDLDNYVAQAVMDGENVEDLCPNLETEVSGKKRKIGYFFLVAEKPLK